MVAWGAIASAAGSLLGSLIKKGNNSNGLLGAGMAVLGNLAGTGINYKVAQKLMEQQIAWQTHMAQNAHQYEVADLKKAGLNPILSADGSGASYSGISGTVSESQLGQQALATYNAIRNTMADTALKEEQTINTANDSIVKGETAKLIGQQVLTQKTQAELNVARTNLATAEAELTSGRNTREERIIAHQIKNLSSQTILNMAGIEKIKSDIKLNRATEKYTNERARGFSETISDTDGFSLGGNANIGKGFFKSGGGANFSKQKGSSTSRTW